MKNERGAGRKPKPDKKVQVGGKMNPDLAAWVKLNGGFPTVEKAVEFYRKSIEGSKMENLFEVRSESSAIETDLTERKAFAMAKEMSKKGRTEESPNGIYHVAKIGCQGTKSYYDGVKIPEEVGLCPLAW